MFSTDTYVRRRQILAGRVSNGIILLLGNEESPMNYSGNVYPFRQDSNFLYFTGLDAPGLALVIDLDRDRTILFGHTADLNDTIWTGPQPSVADRAAASGVAESRPYDDLPRFLAQATAEARFIHILPPYRPQNMTRLCTWLNISMRQLRQMPSVPLIQAVVAQRSVKEQQEIEQMEQAMQVTGAMHRAAMRYARPGIREAQLAGIVEGIAVGAGGGLAYPVIMTTQGQILHNHHHHRILQEGQLVLGDFGADTAMHYAGDVTRTFPVSSTFTQQQREIYQAVLEAQETVIGMMQPGVRFLDLHRAAALLMAKSLRAIGLMKGDMEEATEAGATYLFFPHGLGHMIGLDVHDMEDLGEQFVGYAGEVERPTEFGPAALRFGRSLQDGFVMTVEPGLYFIPELIDQWAAEGKHEAFINYEALHAYRNFGGVRIEDDVLVTAQGARILGDPIPKKIADIEELSGNQAV